MKKLRTSLILMLIAALFVLPVQASALTHNAASAVSQVESIQRYNSRCVSFENILQKCGLEIVDAANAHIEQIIMESCRAAEKATTPAQVDRIIASMLIRTTATSQGASIAAALCGVKTVCEYVEVHIGGQCVYVDPLRVILV